MLLANELDQFSCVCMSFRHHSQLVCVTLVWCALTLVYGGLFQWAPYLTSLLSGAAQEGRVGDRAAHAARFMG
eukprot:1288729-Pyramimonas_sp.AAC.1